MATAITRSNQSYATDAAAVTPSDVTVLAATSAIWVGSTGNVQVRTIDGTTVLITGVPNGTQLNISVDQVQATNTTASDIVAFY